MRGELDVLSRHVYIRRKDSDQQRHQPPRRHSPHNRYEQARAAGDLRGAADINHRGMPGNPRWHDPDIRRWSDEVQKARKNEEQRREPQADFSQFRRHVS